MAQPTNICLLAPHTHDGKQYKAHEVITVTASQARWLKQRGIGADVITKAGAKPKDKTILPTTELLPIEDKKL
ncbi:hypothetical protein UFOVP1367_12 [uncultured Caudovirales phage]|uniref:DUF7210 domain-containing protein n=1 Tax=uncultured Caudovirales phage TaxID=2100421 RepID=A0A6J5S3B0_9CAUD|nr:hypothetical protein KNT69_gp12 [uncultured Caudovirales phage]CAB4202388.1 hypothetical protein UFOVP1367_12 [uncultured Caudovirales phage]